MMSRHIPILVLLLLAVAGHAPVHAQDEGRIVFTDPKSRDGNVLSEDDLQPRTHAWGMDLMIGNDGFGLGSFFHYNLDDALTAFATLSLSEVKDNRQVDYYTYYGDTYSINKLNRVFRIPLFLGLQYRLFKDDIVDNFRPFVNGGVGPVMLYITSAAREFFSSLGHGSPRYTYGGFLGAGAQFGFDRSSVLGATVRYYIIPTPAGTQSVIEGPLPNANGFFIALNLGLSF